MITLVATELSYHRKNLLLLVVIATLAASAPFVLRALSIDPSSATASLADNGGTIAVMAYMLLYAFSFLGAWSILVGERAEHRIELYRRLPLDPWVLAAARLARVAVLPAVWGAVGIGVLLVDSIVRAEAVGVPIAIVGALVVSAVVSLSIITLLLDAGGPRLVQGVVGTLVGGSVVFLVVAPDFLTGAVASAASFVGTPLGFATAALATLTIVFFNLVAQVRFGLRESP